MILSGMMTNSDQGPLSSQGEFNVEVSKNGQPLKLAEGSTFTIENKNAEADKDMKVWVWKENKAVGEAFENNIGEWVRNEFDENNPCKRMKSLWAYYEKNSDGNHSSLWQNIKPLRDLLFSELNKINALSGKKVMAHFDNWADSIFSILLVKSYDDTWLSNHTGFFDDGVSKSGLGSREEEMKFSDFFMEDLDTVLVNPENCLINYHYKEYSFDPNAIDVTFSQLSWCNIDRLLSEYGQISSCKLKGNFPDHAQVKIVFKDLNGALSCNFSDDGFVAKRLPEGYDLMFLVYFKDGDSIKFGTQTITAAEEMTFNEENLKTLTDMDALVEEIEKIVD